MNSRIFDIVKRLGELRDGMLVAGAVVYLVGYFTWSAYSWRERLGPVTPLDAQYFAAGTPITLAFVFTVIVIIGLRRFADTHGRRFLKKHLKARGKFTAVVLGLLIIVLTALALSCFITGRTTAGFAALAGAYILIQIIGASSDKPDPFSRFAPPVVLLLFTAVVVTTFATRIYENIPDSLGGGRPRRVTLDLRIDAVAPSTVRKLLDTSAEAPSSGVVQTREVDLITSQGDYYLILIPATEHGGKSERVQLRRTAVEAITWR